jgi:hypothetical protein
MRLKLLVFATVLFSVAALAQQTAWTFGAPDDVEKFNQSYYQSPRPDIVANLIEAMPMSGFFKRANSVPPFIAFFSEVFLANPTRTARWSLASNAQSHALVRSTLETAKFNSDKRTQEIVTELLVRDPAQVRQDIQDIVRRQKDAGKWR